MENMGLICAFCANRMLSEGSITGPGSADVDGSAVEMEEIKQNWEIPGVRLTGQPHVLPSSYGTLLPSTHCASYTLTTLKEAPPGFNSANGSEPSPG